MPQPTTNTRNAAALARNRLLAELNGKRGVDANRQRYAVRTLFNIVDRYVSGDLKTEVERPSSVERNPQSPTERKVVRYWKAVEHLMDWMFNRDTILKESDIIVAFDAIV